MTRRHRCLIIAIMMTFFISSVGPTSVFAAENPVKTEYYKIESNSGYTKQWKVYKYIYPNKWTSNKVLKGQPSGGTYLKKGGALFYVSNNRGVSATVSFGKEFSVNVPLGKYSSKAAGVIVPADQAGYYVLQNKRYIQPYAIVAVQYRQRTASFMPWGSWKSCNITRRTGYTLIKNKPTLKKK